MGSILQNNIMDKEIERMKRTNAAARAASYGTRPTQIDSSLLMAKPSESATRKYQHREVRKSEQAIDLKETPEKFSHV